VHFQPRPHENVTPRYSRPYGRNHCHRSVVPYMLKAIRRFQRALYTPLYVSFVFAAGGDGGTIKIPVSNFSKVNKQDSCADMRGIKIVDPPRRALL
jgi:hypothetical protein